jgi:integrin beta 1
MLLTVINKIVCATEDCRNVANVCIKESSCGNCKRAHSCCVWCSDQADTFKANRCNIEENLLQFKCNFRFIEYNNETKSTIKVNRNFANFDAESSAVQFRPNEFDINLRYGEAENITVYFQPAKNYPLDLYYLMDLTFSMKQDLKTLINLGSELTTTLAKLTQNYRIAFGSYVDKLAMPFYSMTDREIENPCIIENENCERGYLFKHRREFTNDTDEFIKEIERSDVTANLDNLEGGMDVLMQLLSCQKRLNWLDISRKLVVIATEGGMHLAGDGILAGSIKRNNKKKCLIDDDGNYMNDTLYDYPSLEEVHHELKRKKTNVIIMAKSTILDYYKKMAELAQDTLFVGELEAESMNVLQLVEDGYYAFMKQVALSVDTKDIEGLKVDFFAECVPGEMKKTHTCDNAKEGEPIKFLIQLMLTEYQSNSSATLYVEESKVSEKIKLNINFVGATCDCSYLSNKLPYKCQHGKPECGNCTCDDGWMGTNCSESCVNTLEKCRFKDNDYLSLTCSGFGDCICSKCQCYFPRSGEYCQYECPFPTSTKLICGGHGDCIEGKCQCRGQYIGDDCTCLNSTEDCKIPGSELQCYNNGTCNCDKCSCSEGFYGKYCEKCDTCNGLCNHYESYVIKKVVKNEDVESVENDTVRVTIVEDLDNIQCVYRYEEEEKKCNVNFQYIINPDRSVNIKATKSQCSAPIAAGMLAIIIICAILLAGILAILVIKGRNMYRDRREYQDFIKKQSQGTQSGENPLYKSPVTQYDNPMELVQLHSKQE